MNSMCSWNLWGPFGTSESRLQRFRLSLCIFKCPTPAIVFGNATKTLRFAHFWQGAQSLAPGTRNDIWTSKSGANMWRFVHFDFTKCAARHNSVHFFDISTSKSGLDLVCFVHDFEMCFAPQRFGHLNFEKCFETEVFCAFRFRHVLRATTACNFSSLTWPAGSAPAALASLLFVPLEPQIIGKTLCFATFRPFRAPGSSFFGNFLFLIFFLVLLPSLTLPISAFHLPILSEVWLINLLWQFDSRSSKFDL